MVAGRLVNLKHGGDLRSDDFKESIDSLKTDDPKITLDLAAEKLNVSRPSVQRAKKVPEGVPGACAPRRGDDPGRR